MAEVLVYCEFLSVQPTSQVGETIKICKLLEKYESHVFYFYHFDLQSLSSSVFFPFFFTILVFLHRQPESHLSPNFLSFWRASPYAERFYVRRRCDSEFRQTIQMSDLLSS